MPRALAALALLAAAAVARGADEESYLSAIADAGRLAIATFEVSLEAASGPGGGAVAGAMPGAGAAGGRARIATAAPAQGGAESSSGAMGSGMGGRT